MPLLGCSGIYMNITPAYHSKFPAKAWFLWHSIFITDAVVLSSSFTVMCHFLVRIVSSIECRLLSGIFISYTVFCFPFPLCHLSKEVAHFLVRVMTSLGMPFADIMSALQI